MQSIKNYGRTLWTNLRNGRLSTTFAVLAALTIGVLAGSLITGKVSAGGQQGVDSSDARPLVIPNPVTLSNGFSAIAKQVGPAVVNINTEELPKQSVLHKKRTPGGDDGDQGDNDPQDFFRRFFGGQNPGGDDGEGADGGERRALGSGFIVDPRGYIITNNHVVDKADHIYVKLSTDPDGGPGDEGREATVVGVDKDTDIAVIKIDPKGLTLPTVKLGNSDGAQVGDWVLAIGSPFGLSQTVSAGIVSAKNRSIDEPSPNGVSQSQFQKFIQTDAAINPGNSGGPLVTEDGRIVGITSRAYLGANNLGFAIPSVTARRVVAGLVKDGTITRSYIGIVPKALQDLEGFYDLASNTGVLVDSVEAGSPAAAAGLQAGDIILAIDGKKVDGRFPEQLPPIQNLIASQPVGSTLALDYKRGAREATTTLVTARLDSRMGEEWVSDAWGIGIRKVSVAYARENQLPDDTGVLVIGVQRGFPAEVAGLARGDVITKINQVPVSSVDVLRQIEAAYSGKPAPTLFEVQRERRVSLVVLKP